jgi:hypothetical protein
LRDVRNGLVSAENVRLLYGIDVAVASTGRVVV